ncbi:hypothetical protein ILUMI_27323 [Ignelater luminosus]|uniref:PML C-terminal domain-containing protein n=1 Tax=Ignelater luminosus TaxID=2038154 RepID=A0A8K0C3L9_IGNLU|nr:hypothetical protein ILUMI_27323 [Ignelater luminosus]
MMEQFKKTVVGFADTLTIFKNFLTKRQEEKQSFKVEDLARDFLGPEFTEGLHNAAQDIKILSTLIDKINVPNDKIISMAKSTPFILADRALKKYFKGAVTSVIASKIALGRINLTTLKKAFQFGGYDSVKMLLAENINNKPRVTKNEKTIKAIVDRLDQRDKTDSIGLHRRHPMQRSRYGVDLCPTAVITTVACFIASLMTEENKTLVVDCNKVKRVPEKVMTAL